MVALLKVFSGLFCGNWNLIHGPTLPQWQDLLKWKYSTCQGAG